MGQALTQLKGSAKIPKLLEECQVFSLWKIADVRELHMRFLRQIRGFALVEAQFESILSFKKDMTGPECVPLEKLFEILDNDHDGRLDGLELMGGITLVCQGTFEEKSKFVFELFDFNMNAKMSKKELLMMMMSSINGMNLLAGGDESLEPDVEFFEALAEDAFFKADRDNSGSVTYDELVAWARANRDLMNCLEVLNKSALLAKERINPDDSASEASEEYLSDSGDVEEIHRKTRVDAFEIYNNFVRPTHGDEALAVVQWKGQVHEPTEFNENKYKKGSMEGPRANLSLEWAFGYRARGSRNNLRFVKPQDPNTQFVTFPTAALGVYYNLATREQYFYQGHSSEILCLTLHPSGHIVATADRNSHIHLWDAKTQSCKCIIESMIKHGTQLIEFSPGGDRIATVGLDPDHTIALYDTSTTELISSAKGIRSPANVYDIAYSPCGNELVLVGKNQVKFFVGLQTQRRAMQSKLGRIGKKGKKQSFFSVTYFHAEVIVGCASGELYRFRNHECVQIVQGHGVQEPVLCLHYYAVQNLLISGGKDSLIKTWDETLKEVGSALDMSEDLNGDGTADSGSLDSVVTSVHMLENRLLVGTHGSDIYIAVVSTNADETRTLSRVAWGHSGGELWGLACHPLRDEFATCGSDKTVRIWSIRSREQLNVRTLPAAAHSAAYCPKGEILAIGMEDGSMALLEANSALLRAYKTWKHSSKAILDVKFAPNGYFLAMASADRNIYLYKSEDKKDFRRQAVCRGHSGIVTHIDFSANSRYLQSNGMDAALLFWDIMGNQIKSSSSMKDVIWSTFTCVFGYPVQGIWPPGSDFSDVNCCMAMRDLETVVTGDDFNRINLYKYPALESGALHQTYVGHASHVTNVRFNYNRRYVVSIGGADCTVLLWKHNLEENSDSERDESDGTDSSEGHSPHTSADEIDVDKEVARVGERGVHHEAANQRIPREEDTRRNASDVMQVGDKSGPKLVPWKTSVIEPNYHTDKDHDHSTDSDLTLKWIHGYRSYDCRNNLFYSSKGNIVYPAGCVAVIYDHRSTCKQNFLQGAHRDEILGMAIHPASHIFATGEAGQNPSIVIWSSVKMSVMQRLHKVHEKGIPFLAFNAHGNLLATVGHDADNTLVLHEWATGVELMKTPTTKQPILAMCFECPAQEEETESREIIVMGGKNHLSFWWFKGQNVSSQRGLWTWRDRTGTTRKEKKCNILCMTSIHPGVTITGTACGKMYMWKDFKIISDVTKTTIEAGSHLIEFPYPHMVPNEGAIGTVDKKEFKGSAVQAIWGIKGKVMEASEMDHMAEYPEIDYRRKLRKGLRNAARVITGDAAGTLAIWRLVEVGVDKHLTLVCVASVSLMKFTPPPISASVRAISEQNGILLIGTKASEVYELRVEDVLDNDNQYTRNSAAAHADSSPESKGNEVAMPGLHIETETDDPDIRAERVIAGHSQRGIWGLAMHPSKPVYFTAGDDGTVRCWALEQHRMLSYTILDVPMSVPYPDFNSPDKYSFSFEYSRALAIDPAGEDIAFALNGGAILITQTEHFLRSLSDELDEEHEGSQVDLFDESQPKYNLYFSPANDHQEQKRHTRHWSQVIKYSFDGSLLAQGAHDGYIYLHEVSVVNGKKQYTWLKTIFHGAHISHLDFGVSGIKLSMDDDKQTQSSFFKSCEVLSVDPQSQGATSSNMYSKEAHLILQSSCTGGELRFWKIYTDKDGQDGKNPMELNSSEVKDALWATWTSPYGWPVQGVWPPNPDGTEIKAVSRCRNWEAVEVIASVDNFGRVRLFHFPCIHIGAPDKCYRGHAGNILNVDFSYNDEYCITVGGDDKCIFVWKTDILEDLRERKQSKLLVARTKGKKKDGGLDASLREDGMMGSNQSNYLFYIDPDPSEQPEYQGLQQWRKSVRDPTTWTDPPHFERPVEEILELQFVHGYRGWDCRNNIGYADVVDEIVYHTAGVGIVYDVKEDRQVHNTEHTGEIVCLAMHPAGHTVATGQYLGEGPKLVLWDANTGVTVRVIDFHRRGVSQVAFSGSGSLLISIGMDVDKTVAVHNVETGALVGDAKAGMLADIFALAVGGDKKFVTGGKNHCKFWDLPRFSHPGGELSSKAGIFNKNVIDSTPTVVSVVFIDADVITGMSDGSLGLWKGRTNTRMETGHTGAVTAMCALPSTSTTAIKGSQGAEVATGGEDGLVIIWNDQLVKLWSLDLKLSSPTSMKPMVQALAAKEGRVLIGTKASEIYEVDLINLNQEILMKYVQGHYEETAKISGLACHPSKKQYVTIGGDLSVRLWCARDRQQVNILTLGAEALAVEYTPDGTQVLVGTDDGRLHVLTESLSNVIASYTVASGLIDVIAVSPDGHSIAIGTRDRSIYILDGKNFSVRAQCEGHSFYVTAIDFSSDGKYIQSTNGRLDLLFFDAYSGDYITTPSSMRDVTWATQTCTLGWSTQGLHAPPNTDISKSVNVNINCVDRSPQGNILASGDDSRGMRICRFPALLNHGLQPPQKVYRAHSHPVSKVRFGFDGNFVISVGGADKTIVQWEVKRPKKSSTFIGR